MGCRWCCYSDAQKGVGLVRQVGGWSSPCTYTYGIYIHTIQIERPSMKEVRITVDMGRRRPGSYEVALQLDDNVTCGDVLQLLVESLALKPRNKKGEWRLVECWRGCREYNGSYPAHSFTSLCVRMQNAPYLQNSSWYRYTQRLIEKK